MVHLIRMQYDLEGNSFFINHRQDWWKLTESEATTFRKQKGRFDYTPCDEVELRSFCIGRRLIKPDYPFHSWYHFARMLSVADAHETFEKLLELPRELRCRIYELYFRSFDVLDQPVQPPISQVSRLLRTETLPVFYEVCHFWMDTTEMSICPRSKDFFRNIPIEHLGWIRKLVLVGNVYHEGRGVRVEWQIELGRPETYSRRSFLLVGAAEDKVNRSFARMTEFLQHLDGREGKQRLTRADLDGIFKVLREGWVEEEKLYLKR
jgi:hypothetical protein